MATIIKRVSLTIEERVALMAIVTRTLPTGYTGLQHAVHVTDLGAAIAFEEATAAWEAHAVALDKWDRDGRTASEKPVLSSEARRCRLEAATAVFAGAAVEQTGRLQAGYAVVVALARKLGCRMTGPGFNQVKLDVTNLPEGFDVEAAPPAPEATP